MDFFAAPGEFLPQGTGSEAATFSMPAFFVPPASSPFMKLITPSPSQDSSTSAPSSSSSSTPSSSSSSPSAVAASSPADSAGPPSSSPLPAAAVAAPSPPQQQPPSVSFSLVSPNNGSTLVRPLASSSSTPTSASVSATFSSQLPAGVDSARHQPPILLPSHLMQHPHAHAHPYLQQLQAQAQRPYFPGHHEGYLHPSPSASSSSSPFSSSPPSFLPSSHSSPFDGHHRSLPPHHQQPKALRCIFSTCSFFPGSVAEVLAHIQSEHLSALIEESTASEARDRFHPQLGSSFSSSSSSASSSDEGDGHKSKKRKKSKHPHSNSSTYSPNSGSSSSQSNSDELEPLSASPHWYPSSSSPQSHPHHGTGDDHMTESDSDDDNPASSSSQRGSTSSSSSSSKRRSVPPSVSVTERYRGVSFEKDLVGPYSCIYQYCPRFAPFQFATKAEYVHHIAHAHDDTRLRCLLCPSSFTQQHNRQSHCRRSHIHEPSQFHCFACGAKFGSGALMRMHARGCHLAIAVNEELDAWEKRLEEEREVSGVPLSEAEQKKISDRKKVKEAAEKSRQYDERQSEGSRKEGSRRSRPRPAPAAAAPTVAAAAVSQKTAEELMVEETKRLVAHFTTQPVNVAAVMT